MVRKIAFIGKVKPKKRKSFWATKSWKLKNGRIVKETFHKDNEIVKETFHKDNDDQLSIWLSLEHLFKCTSNIVQRIKKEEKEIKIIDSNLLRTDKKLEEVKKKIEKNLKKTKISG